VSVDTAAVPGTPDQVDINVNVEERPLGALTLGVGFSSTDNLVLSGSITQQNFLGTGTNVALEVNTSKARQVLSFSHIDPYWTDDGVSRSISLYTRKFEPDELNLGQYGIQSTGLGIRFGLPYTEDDRLSFGLSYESTKLSDVTPSSPLQIRNYFNDFGANTDAYILSLGWSKDTRDSGLAPTRGGSQYLNFDYATPLGKLSYGRFTYGRQHYFPVSRSVTLAMNADFSYGFGLDKKEYPVLKNFYAGGIGSIRGFSGGSVGPYDQVSNSHTGGNRSLILNGELLFPFPGMGQDRSMRLFTFVDAGNVWAAEDKLDLGELRASAGFGLSWLSPVGPLKLSFGWPLRKFDDDEVQKVQFQIGTGF
jgi:outer membrane protein insertion porin family